MNPLPPPGTPGYTQALLAGDPLWLTIAKVIVVFALLLVMTLFMIWLERRVVGRMQQRLGPNWNGPFGLLQSLADGLKLAFKEDIRPTLADFPVFFIAPVISTIPAFVAFAVIPLGPEVSIFGHHTALQVADLPVGILVVLACSSLGVYGIVLSGWASGSPYPLLGGLRSAAQVISYELALGPVDHRGGPLRRVALDRGHRLRAGERLVHLAAAGELRGLRDLDGRRDQPRPFDLAEAESELVGGFHTEYSSLKFALFFLAEYVNMVTLSAVATTLFLGGWRAPWPLSLWAGANEGWFPVIWFISRCSCSSSSSSGCAGRCPASATTSSCGWAGRSSSRSAWCGSVAVSALRVAAASSTARPARRRSCC